MAKEIKILSSDIVKDTNNKVRLEYKIEVPGKSGTLWFRTSKKWEKYLCPEIADGVVVTLLLYAIRGGYDINSNIALSKEMLNKLRYHVIPQLALCTKNSYESKIICPMKEEHYEPTAVATAMSMGIDSFTTFFEYTKDCPPESERINLLTHFQSGQTSFEDDEDGLFAEQLEDAQRFADENGFELLDVASNLYSLYKELFWDEWMIHVSTYRNCGMALLFQKLIKTYYYSSSYNLDIFHCSLNEDVTHYEKWLLPNISTDSTRFLQSNKAMTRIEKTKYVSTFPETYDYLQVCVHARHNCGICDKCARTQLTLESMGRLENYKNVFNLDDFKINRKYLVKVMLIESKNEINKQVLDLYKNDVTLPGRVTAGIIRVRRHNKKINDAFDSLHKVVPNSRDIAEKIRRMT